jgi:hypothetical protein
MKTLLKGKIKKGLDKIVHQIYGAQNEKYNSINRKKP